MMTSTRFNAMYICLMRVPQVDLYIVITITVTVPMPSILTIVHVFLCIPTVSCKFLMDASTENYETDKENSQNYGIIMSNYTKNFDNLPSKNCLNKKLNKCLCTNDAKKKKHFVNSWSKHKRTIPLTLPRNTTHLDFSFNTLRRLRNGRFKNTTKLIFLDLTHSFIDYIETAAFIGLQKLQVLDLSLNHFKMIHHIFSPLRSL